MQMKEKSLQARMEFRYRARLQSREKHMEQDKPDIATKAELERLRNDRKNDAAIPASNQPVPSWMVQPNHPERIRQRTREHRINQLTNRLQGANRSLNKGGERG